MKARLRATIRGAVQGVGFRPFVFRLAEELRLHGWVSNSAQGVFLEVEGARDRLEDFRLRLEREKPARSFIQSLEATWLDPVGYTAFEIRESDPGGAKTALVLPDIATCPDCLREILDPKDRRYYYPFTNCTNCGPRFSIIHALPYDRANTSMARFTMCSHCQAEYENPRNRRFHAQPNACPLCGPQLALWDTTGKPLAKAGAGRSTSWDLVGRAVQALRDGKILAVKGLGGFHLMVAAHMEESAQRLRQLKHREEKPFALMFPSLAVVRQACRVSALEERLLLSPESPIVLLERREPVDLGLLLGRSLAPGNPYFGVMLPYTPLHHLLLRRAGFPVVATSGNLSDEPICTDEHEAVERLGGIADLFVVHDRPIARHVDDSIVRVMAGRELVLRRARGFAPLPLALPRTNPPAPCVLAVGAHLKNAVALSVADQAFISQHIGDLETDAAYEAFQRVIGDFESLYAAKPTVVVNDLHPDYLSTKLAAHLTSGGDEPRPARVQIQHHVAHVLSCMAENELRGPVLGVSWDGTGYGTDGTVWGGEFFRITNSEWSRVAHFRTFPLPGGEKAIKEPRRCALGLLYEIEGKSLFGRTGLPLQAFAAAELKALEGVLARAVNSPRTSSAGRLFDAVASLAGLCQLVRYEGQAAMELEFALRHTVESAAYPLQLVQPPTVAPGPDGPAVGPAILDWTPMVEAVLADVSAGVPVGTISARFHNGLVEGIIAVAQHFKIEAVALSGGCFQNRYLTERAIHRLQEAGFRPYWHQRVPPNDGGIALGQVIAAMRGVGPKAQGESET